MARRAARIRISEQTSVAGREELRDLLSAYQLEATVVRTCRYCANAGRYSPVTEETSAKRPFPTFRNAQFFSWPLHESPCRIMSLISAQPARYSCSLLRSVPVGDCDTTCRQKKLHKSLASSCVM